MVDHPLHQFVRLSATNHARTYGLSPRKGDIAIGADADLALWDPTERRVVTAAMLHDAAGYTPYEGRELTGWPTTVISRGDVIVENGQLYAARGRGRYLAREIADSARPAGLAVPEVRQLQDWGTPLPR